MTNPEVAFRDCSHCRKFVYDEKTGEPRMTKGRLLPRVKPPPCETDGCKKGHWSKPIELSAQGLRAVRWWQRVRATNGGYLTEAEKADSWCAHVLATLDDFQASYDRTKQASEIALAVSKALAVSRGFDRGAKR